MNTINQRVKELRMKLGLSQDDFGNAIGLSKSGISNIENGARSVRESHIKLLCANFDVSESWLRTGEDVPEQDADFEAFENYLQTLGYRTEYDYDEVFEDEIVENVVDGKVVNRSTIPTKASFLITLKKFRQTATFNETEYAELQAKYFELQTKLAELEADYQDIIKMRIQKKAEAQRKK